VLRETCEVPVVHAFMNPELPQPAQASAGITRGAR
jgi:hypothetical protein